MHTPTVDTPTWSGANKLRFTKTISNIGNHYNQTTGIFTCVIPGIYHFDFHLYRAAGADRAFSIIVKDGSSALAAVDTDLKGASTSSQDSSSTSVVVHLVQGDEVSIGACTGIETIYSNMQTSFSGVLITED